jgi:tetratricopeptide (TPR) repeat protein
VQDISLILKRTSKPASFLAIAVLFFIFYNRFLVDHSLINLNVALTKLNQARTLSDFKKIEHLFKMPLLKEMTKANLSPRTLMYMELAENTAATAKNMGQIEDLKFYVKSLMLEKEKERGGFISGIDRLNSAVLAPELNPSVDKLRIKEKDILRKVQTTTDKDALQLLYYDLGNLYTQLSDLPRAKEAFVTAIKVNPESQLAMKAKFNYAWACKVMGEYQKAVTLFDEVSTEYARRKEMAIAGQYEVADTFYKSGDYQKARDKYAQIADEFKELDLADVALFEAGHITFNNLNDPDRAIKYFNKLEEKFPESKVVKHVIDKVRPLMSSDFRKKGFELLKVKLFNQAIENFQKAVEIAPSDTGSLSGLGLGFYWLNDKQAAVAEAGKAIEIAKMDELVLINTFFIYINSGKIDEVIRLGIEVTSKALIPRAEFYYNFGYAYVLKSKLEEAKAEFEKAVRINPDFIYAYNNLGCCLWALGKYSEAIRFFKMAIDRDPAYADAYFNQGVAYFNLNRLEDAYDEFKKVLEINPGYFQAQQYADRITQILGYRP